MNQTRSSVQTPSKTPSTRQRTAAASQSNQDALQDMHHAQDAADRGVQGGGGTELPFLERIQESFGHHDLDGVGAFIGGEAAGACDSLGADAYAVGDAVAFKGSPDLHTAAHEAAHVVQQRDGVQLEGGFGAADDVYEKHADAVADKVVAGESAEALLDGTPGGGSGCGVQRKASGPQVTAGPGGGAIAHNGATLGAKQDGITAGHKLFELAECELPLPVAGVTAYIKGEVVATGGGGFDGSTSLEGKASLEGGLKLTLGFKGLSASVGAGLELSMAGKVTARPSGRHDMTISGGLKGKLFGEIEVAGLLKIPWDGPSCELVKLAGLTIKDNRIVDLGTPSIGGDLEWLLTCTDRLGGRFLQYLEDPRTLYEDLKWLMSLGADIDDMALAAAKKAYDAAVVETQEGISAFAGATGLGEDVYARRKEIAAEIQEGNVQARRFQRLMAPLKAYSGYYDVVYHNEAYKLFQDNREHEINMKQLVLAAQRFKKDWPRNEEANWLSARPSAPHLISRYESEKNRFRLLWRSTHCRPFRAVGMKPLHTDAQLQAMEAEAIEGLFRDEAEHLVQQRVRTLRADLLRQELFSWAYGKGLERDPRIAKALENDRDIELIRALMLDASSRVAEQAVRFEYRVEMEM